MVLDAPRQGDVLFEEQGVTVVLLAKEAEAIGDFAVEYWGPPGLGFLRARALGGGSCAAS